MPPLRRRHMHCRGKGPPKMRGIVEAASKRYFRDCSVSRFRRVEKLGGLPGAFIKNAPHNGLVVCGEYPHQAARREPQFAGDLIRPELGVGTFERNHMTGTQIDCSARCL